MEIGDDLDGRITNRQRLPRSRTTPSDRRGGSEEAPTTNYLPDEIE